MIRLNLTVCFFHLAFFAFSQDDPSYLHNRSVMERMVSQGVSGNTAALGNMSVSKPGLIGDVYLNRDYRNATFLLYENNQLTASLPAKLDLQRNEFDVLMTNGVRALAGSHVRTMVWSDSVSKVPQYFVNAKEYKDDKETPYYGFFQILSEGEITLLKLTEVRLKPADRNLSHSVGTNDNKFLKISTLLYAVSKTAQKLPNKKGTMKLLESRKEEIEKFIDVNDLDLSRENHLTAVFDYYNSLVKK